MSLPPGVTVPPGLPPWVVRTAAHYPGAIRLPGPPRSGVNGWLAVPAFSYAPRVFRIILRTPAGPQ